MAIILNCCCPKSVAFKSKVTLKLNGDTGGGRIQIIFRLLR